MCFDSSEVKRSALTKQHEQRTLYTRRLCFLMSQAPVPVPELTSLEDGGKKKTTTTKKKYNVQRPNGRLMLFVPVCDDRRLHSWLFLCYIQFLHQESS